MDESVVLEEGNENEVLSIDGEAILEQLRRINFEITTGKSTYAAEYLTTSYVSNLFKEILEGDASAYSIFQDAKNITERYHESMEDVPPPDLPGDDGGDDDNTPPPATAENISVDNLVKISNFIFEYSAANKISIEELLNNKDFLDYLRKNISSIISSKEEIELISKMSDSELQEVLLKYINSIKTDDNIVNDTQDNLNNKYEEQKKILSNFIEFLNKNYLMNLSDNDKNNLIGKLLLEIDKYYQKMSYFDVGSIKNIFMELHDNNYYQESNNGVHIFNKFFIENMSIENKVSVEELLLGNNFDAYIKDSVDNLSKYMSTLFS